MTDKLIPIGCVVLGWATAFAGFQGLLPGHSWWWLLALIPGAALVGAGIVIGDLLKQLMPPDWCATPKAETPSAAPYWLDEHRDDLRPGRTICPGDDDYPDGPNWIKHKEIG